MTIESRIHNLEELDATQQQLLANSKKIQEIIESLSTQSDLE